MGISCVPLLRSAGVASLSMISSAQTDGLYQTFFLDLSRFGVPWAHDSCFANSTELPLTCKSTVAALSKKRTFVHARQQAEGVLSCTRGFSCRGSASQRWSKESAPPILEESASPDPQMQGPKRHGGSCNQVCWTDQRQRALGRLGKKGTQPNNITSSRLGRLIQDKVQD
jgi:hypothetical protein